MSEETFSKFEAGPSACPFVAYEDDRDHRSNVPDYRHRCFAASDPEPRAFPHQERYCLSADFAQCPIFLDWARQEAAGVLQPGRPGSTTVSRDPSPASAIVALGGASGAGDADAPAFLVARPRQSVGTDAAATRAGPDPSGGLWGYEGDTNRPTGPSAPVPPSSIAPPSVVMARRGPSHPGWELPAREEHFPRLRSRDDRRANQPLLLAAIGISILMVGFLIGPLVLGQKASPSVVHSAGPSSSTAVTSGPTASPTTTAFTVYHVKTNDTIAGIARLFNLQLFEIEAANPQITDFNHIEIGQIIYVPPVGHFTPAPTAARS